MEDTQALEEQLGEKRIIIPEKPSQLFAVPTEEEQQPKEEKENPLKKEMEHVSFHTGIEMEEQPGQENEEKEDEVQQQIRFSVNYPNRKDKDLYSAKLVKKKTGIIFSEPITVRHWRDPELIAKWTNVAAVVKNEKENSNLSRDMSVKAQAVNIMDRPVKKILYRFPDGMKVTNKFFNDDELGLAPADEFELVKWPLDLPDGQFKTQKKV